MKRKSSGKFRYRFENFMSSGGGAVFFSLFVLLVISLLVTIGLRAALWYAAPPDNGTAFSDHVWSTMLEVMDAGNLGEETDNPVLYKFLGFIGAMVGIFVFSMVIAFITTKLDELFYNLRRGRSRVIEENHTLIIGWNDRVFDIIDELVEANASEKRACIVILADVDKEEMDEKLRKRLPGTRTTKIVTRQGSTSSISDLEIVSAATARSAIILAEADDCSDHEEKRQSDVKAIKIILALTTLQGGENKLNIAAEVFNDESVSIFKTFDSDTIVPVKAQEILGKCMVQTSMSSGLEMVLGELLSFYGSEVYFYGADWDNTPFSELVYHFKDGIPLGIYRKDGTLILHAKKDDKLGKGDELIILGSDDSAVDYKKNALYKPADHPFTMTKIPKTARRELILGWHSIAPIVISEFSDYLIKGSVIDIMFSDPSEEVQKVIRDLQKEHADIIINLIPTNPFDMDDLKAVQPYSYDNIVILSQDENDFTAERNDSDTLIILLLLRQIRKEIGEENAKSKVITQILNTENQELIFQSSVDDFLISSKLISTLLAQLSEEPRMNELYDALFGEEGSEIYLKNAALYFDDLPAEVTFADIIHAAGKRDEICMGVQLAQNAGDAEANFGVALNPAKDAKYKLSGKDCLIVLSEDET